VTLARLLEKGLVERVERDREAADAMLEEARRHLASATTIAAEDPNGAYQLLYDAARKAIAAHMAANGYRVPRGRPGAHDTTGRYAMGEISAAKAVAQFDRMRRNRNRSEYEFKIFGDAEVRADLRHAEEIVEIVAEQLSTEQED
jgi:hypothetical protein